MKTIKTQLSKLEKIENKLIVLFGKFDGLHVGHQELIINAKQLAKEKGAYVAVVSFDPHPLVVIKGLDVRQLTTSEEKKDILEELEVDYFIELEFNEELKNLEKEDFIKAMKSSLNIDTVIIGNDFRFGKNGQGNYKTLIDANINVSLIEDVLHDSNNKVGSSLIRKMLQDGDIKEANELLTREYSVRGKVVKGSQIGRTIGFPTANVEMSSNKVYPNPGVYATRVDIDGEVYNSITNIGVNPTVTNQNILKVEVHVLYFNGDLYGKEVQIYFVDRIRQEQKFSTLEELKMQLSDDKKVALELINKKNV